MIISMALGLCAIQTASEVDIPSGFEARILSDEDATLIITAEPANGEIELTVSVDGVEIGSFTLSEAQYSAPAHNLIAPQIGGTADVGQVLTSTNGLWLVDPETGSTMTYQWLRDGEAIPGETGTEYTIQSADEGTSLSLRESIGSISVETAPMAVAAAVVNNLIDVSAVPDNRSRMSHVAIPGGRLMTQTQNGSPRVGWTTLEPLQNGATYRLRGTVMVNSPLERTGEARISDVSSNGADIVMSVDLFDGETLVDATFSVPFATKDYRLYFFIDQLAGIGSTSSITDFILEEI